MLVCLGASVQRYSLIYLFIFQLVAEKIQILEDNVFLPKTQSTLATSGSSLKIKNKTKKDYGLGMTDDIWLVGWVGGWEDQDRPDEGTQPFVSFQVCREEVNPDSSSIGRWRTPEPCGAQPKSTAIHHSNSPLAYVCLPVEVYKVFFLVSFCQVFYSLSAAGAAKAQPSGSDWCNSERERELQVQV